MRIEIARNECRRASRKGDTLTAVRCYMAACRLSRQCRSSLKVELTQEAKRESTRIIDWLLQHGSRLTAHGNTLYIAFPVLPHKPVYLSRY